MSPSLLPQRQRLCASVAAPEGVAAHSQSEHSPDPPSRRQLPAALSKQEAQEKPMRAPTGLHVQHEAQLVEVAAAHGEREDQRRRRQAPTRAQFAPSACAAPRVHAAAQLCCQGQQR